jgi:hypothetical protein
VTGINRAKRRVAAAVCPFFFCGSHAPDPAPGVCFARLRSSWSPPLAPPPVAGIVRRLHGYYGGVRLPPVVHHRLWLLAFPMRTRAAHVMSAAGRPWDLPVPVQEASAHARVCDHAGSSGRSQIVRPCVWPSTFGTVSAPGMIGLSRFNGWPVHSPAGALADVCARLSTDVDRYSFIVTDLHPLLLVGLPAHSENLHKSGSHHGSARCLLLTSLTFCAPPFEGRRWLTCRFASENGVWCEFRTIGMKAKRLILLVAGSAIPHCPEPMRQHFTIGDERHNQSRHATYPRLATALAGQLTVA